RRQLPPVRAARLFPARLSAAQAAIARRGSCARHLALRRPGDGELRVADIGMSMKAGNEPSGSGRPGLPGLGLSGPGLAAAILLHAAVLASFLLQPVKPLPPAPGAAAIMVSLVQAGAVQKQKEAEQEEEKTGPPQPEPLQ